MPKITDFGVAKAVEQRLTEKSVFTELGQLIGTPEYMSPEQADLTALDIDTRTDVYSLGGLPYELLVGALPFDPRSLRQAGFDEMAWLRYHQGRYEDAEALQREALSIRRRLLGHEHNRTLETASNLATALRAQGQYDEALELYKTVYETRARTDGEDHPRTLRNMNNMASVYAMSGRFEQADALYAECIEHRLKVLG